MTDKQAALNAAHDLVSSHEMQNGSIRNCVGLGFKIAALILAQRPEGKIEALKWVMDERWTGEGHIYEGIEAEIVRLEGEQRALDAAREKKP